MRYRRYLLINPRTVFIAGALISTAWSTSGAQSTSLARRGTVAGSASTMVASAQLLAIAEGPTVRMIDVSRPGSAVVVGEYTFADEVLALAVDGSTVYVANSHEGLHRLDVSNPAAPVAQDVSLTRGQAVGVAVSGEHAFVADNSLGFDVISTTGAVSRVGEYLGDGFPRAIGAMGNFVFVADQPNGLIVVDVSIPAAPEPVGMLSFGADMITRVIVPQEVAGEPRPSVVYVASARAGLQVVDVSTPSAPVVVAPISTAGQPRGIAIRGQEVFVISNGTLELFDLSQPLQPSRVVSWDVGEQAGLLAVNEDLIFVAIGGEVVIFERG